MKLSRDTIFVAESYNMKILVECQECGKKFKTRAMLPTCPRCKGSDIDLQR